MTYRLVSKQQVTRYQQETYCKTQQRLTTLWTRYDNDEIRTSDFLKHISNLYAPCIPAPNLEEVDTDTDSDQGVNDIIICLVLSTVIAMTILVYYTYL